LEDGANTEDIRGHEGAVDRPCQESSSSCTPEGPIIMHSKVYTFAHQFLCSKLKTLALHRLILILQSANSKANDFLPCLIDAARHIYDHTQEQTSEPEPARALIMQFLVKHLNDSNHDLDDLVSESDFTRDLFRETLKRATTAEQKLATKGTECTQKDEKIRKLKGIRCKRCIRSSSPDEDYCG
jgi:hypothetical protein